MIPILDITGAPSAVTAAVQSSTLQSDTKALVVARIAALPNSPAYVRVRVCDTHDVYASLGNAIENVDSRTTTVEVAVIPAPLT